MSKRDKIFASVMSGKKDNVILFDDLCKILDVLGFGNRIKGSHHIYYKENIVEILNLQPDRNLAKPYQVEQVRNLILKYKLEVTK
jgi:predicted RNA binding protein YcfA (HicA-like mRNA interferase family)